MKSLPPNHAIPDQHPLSTHGLALRRTWIEIETHRIEAELATPLPASSWVVFPRRTRYTASVARHFNASGLATMRAELALRSAPPERAAASMRRLQAALVWLRRQPEYTGERVGLFTGGDPDATVAMEVASAQASAVARLACWGRPETLTRYAGPAWQTPTLLLIGEPDRATRRHLQRWMRRHLAGPGNLIVVPGLDAFLDDPAVLRRVAEAALPWFREHKETGLILPVTASGAARSRKRKMAAAGLAMALGTVLLPGTAVANVTATFSNGTLTVTSDSAGDQITVSTDSEGFLQVNGDFVLDSEGSSIQGFRVEAININGGGGDDTINLLDVDDSRFPELGTVSVDAGDGDDFILGSGKSDSILGGEGDDFISETRGDNFIDGGPGNDQIFGDGDGTDTLLGGSGNDTLDSGSSTSPNMGDKMLDGGDDNDSLIGSDGPNTLLGGDGLDTLLGLSGDDSLDGGLGLDTLLGGDGDDTLDGGEGDDTLLGGLDSDSLMGGLGLDTLLGEDGDDTLSGGLGSDSLDGGLGLDTLLGGDGADTLDGGLGLDTLLGGDDDDSITGSGGDDSIFGGSGLDTLLGGDGNDSITGGLDADSILGGLGDDDITDEDDVQMTQGETIVETIDGGPGNNIIRTKPKRFTQNILGGDGNDTLCVDLMGFRFFLDEAEGKITTDDFAPICFEGFEEIQTKNPSPTGIEEETGDGAVSEGEDAEETQAVVEVPGTHLLPGVYPNPFNGEARFEVAVSERQQVRIVLYDVMGRQVGQLHEGTLDPFRLYAVTVDGTRLTSGLYVYVVTGETFRDTGTMLVVK